MSDASMSHVHDERPLEFPGSYVCMTCGHKLNKEEEPDAERIVTNVCRNVLWLGNGVQMIKGLKLKRISTVLKSGMKSKPIRHVDRDHEISRWMHGILIGLKACFVEGPESFSTSVDKLTQS